MTQADADRLDSHGERLATLEAEVKNTRQSLDELKSGQRRIFGKLDELGQAFAKQPAKCMAECRQSILTATDVMNGKVDRMGARVWKVVGIILAVPAAIIALVLLGKSLL